MKPKLTARVASGNLSIERAGAVLYSGSVLARPVEDAIPLDDVELVAVLTEAEVGWHPSSNLVAIPAGDLAWIAELPDSSGGESYVSIHRADEGELGATSWSGYRVTIDRRSGAILRRAFTK